jgi:hypothetical protein
VIVLWSKKSVSSLWVKAEASEENRLPTVEELEKLVRSQGECCIRKPLRLSGWWVWSSSKDFPNYAWNLNFSGGQEHSPLGSSYRRRALCVRGSGE